MEFIGACEMGGNRRISYKKEGGKFMKTSRSRAVLLAMVVLFSVFVSQGTGAQTINGSVKTVGSQRILNLWGTNYEMGYAHGYLMASEIRDLVDNVMIGYLSGGYVSYYNDLIEDDTAMLTWRSEYLEEINGMVAGMVASGKNIYVPKLSRNVDARDIRAFNLILEYVSCSSLGVWGNGTANGETLLGRNLDFFVDSKGNLTNYQMIVTLEPAVGRKKVIWGWAGMVGIHSGMTEDGVSLMINFGDGGVAGGNGPFSVTMADMRWILDKITLQDFLTAPLAMVKSVSEYFTVLIQMGSPYLGG
ncbi:MAG TPA: C45 family autoproteolytic acyltransferase/hydrolase, partial [Saprospiraceae bacterium]|nr:C45 family autoproteolytic acyltransferase/hydrolase [Saprospiraceae bacterium]